MVSVVFMIKGTTSVHRGDRARTCFLMCYCMAEECTRRMSCVMGTVKLWLAGLVSDVCQVLLSFEV